MPYITVSAEVEIDLNDYKDEIMDALNFDDKVEKLKEYISELEKELYFYKEKFWRTPQQILEDLKNL